MQEGELGELVSMSSSSTCDVYSQTSTTVWMVRWNSVGTRAVTGDQSQIQKCKPEDYYQVGDIVKSSYALSYPNNITIAKGALGILQSLSGMCENCWTVTWNQAAACVSELLVSQDAICKCSPDEYLKEEDVVKAAYDLTYYSESHGTTITVERGTLGVLHWVSEGQATVNWSSFDMPNLPVKTEQIQKCRPEEFLKVGQIVKAERNLSF